MFLKTSEDFTNFQIFLISSENLFLSNLQICKNNILVTIHCIGIKQIFKNRIKLISVNFVEIFFDHYLIVTTKISFLATSP